jgi:hypothetical protein
MSELPPVPFDDRFGNRKRISLAVLAVLLVVILMVAVLVSLAPTICCGVFSNMIPLP